MATRLARGRVTGGGRLARHGWVRSTRPSLREIFHSDGFERA